MATKEKKFRLFRRKGKEEQAAADGSSNTKDATPPSVVSVSSPVSEISNKPRRVRYQQPTQKTTDTPKTVDTNAAAVVVPPTNKPAPVTIQGSSWLSRTAWFSKMADWAFQVVDADGSGEVDEKELYSGLLLIHLKLGCYAGPAACRPVHRQRVHDIFVKMDVDHSGALDRQEFHEVMTVLCSNVLTRVMVQWSMTLVIVPLVAQYILEGIYWLNGHFWALVMDLDEYSPMMDRLEVFIERVRDEALNKMPEFLCKWGNKVMEILEKVPQSVWNTVPLTLLSCVLGCLAVPYLIFKVDDFFQSVADKKKATLTQTAA